MAKKKEQIRTWTQMSTSFPPEEPTEERMKVVTELWNGDVRAEHSYKKNPKDAEPASNTCEENGIPWQWYLEPVK